MDQRNPARPYMWAIVALGASALLYSVYRLPVELLDLRYLLMVVLVCLSSHAAVRIPRISGRITVSDTLIFLTILLLGGEAAVLLSALEGVYASLRISRKALTLLFNSAVLALSTFLTVWAVRGLFGAGDLTGGVYSAQFLASVFVMAFVQYFVNSGLIAVEKSLKLGESVWQTWKNHYLWTSVTYLAGASAASITAHLVHAVGFYAVLAAVPVIITIYLTYRTYLKNFEASEAHVQELSRYVAELKRSEEEREKLLHLEQAARAEAEAANRLKDEFLATLSHELRTPLTSIIGWAGLLRSNQVQGEARTQALETIERNAKIQSQLIDDLLDVSRIISGKLLLDISEIRLGPVVADSIEAVRPAAEAKCIRLTYEDGSARGMISGDPARLQQVVWNLLSNAVKFTPEGGEVRVRLARSGAQVVLTVSDTGRGIPAEFLRHVFDRFRQADSTSTRVHGGLGLGLSIVRHLVEMHGGTVMAESPGVGLGSTFSVSLPLAPASMRAAQMEDRAEMREVVAPRRRVAVGLSGLRVLIVDDEDDTRKVITAVMAQHGAEVVACGSAREALDAIQWWRPDILMSDIGMPGEDGYALIRQVRALPADSGGRTPAAALTAYAREEDRRRALAAGFQLHVSKPFSAHELIAAVSNLHTYHV